MKRAICFILTLAMLMAVSVPALAANDVEITAIVEEGFVIKIPEATTSLSFGVTEAQDFGTIGLQSAKLAPGHQVTITVSSNDGLVNSIDANKKIEYTIMDGSTAFTSANFTDTTLKTLTIVVAKAQWDAAPAGNYSDTVTFSAVITDINP